MGTCPSPFSPNGRYTIHLYSRPRHTRYSTLSYNPSSYNFRARATYTRSRSRFDSTSPLLPSASPYPSFSPQLVASSLFLPPAPPPAPQPPPLLLLFPSPAKDSPFRDAIGTCSTSQSNTAESRSVDRLSPSSDDDDDGDGDGGGDDDDDNDGDVDDNALSSRPKLTLVPCACCTPSARPRSSKRPSARTKRPQSASPHASLLLTTEAKSVSRSSIPLAPRNAQ